MGDPTTLSTCEKIILQIQGTIGLIQGLTPPLMQLELFEQPEPVLR